MKRIVKELAREVINSWVGRDFFFFGKNKFPCHENTQRKLMNDFFERVLMAFLHHWPFDIWLIDLMRLSIICFLRNCIVRTRKNQDKQLTSQLCRINLFKCFSTCLTFYVYETFSEFSQQAISPNRNFASTNIFASATKSKIINQCEIFTNDSTRCFPTFQNICRKVFYY